MIEVFQNLEQDKDARIIRNLCRLRTAIEQNYTQILYEFRYNMKSLHTLPQMIPTECLTELERDGISLYRANHKLEEYLMDINRHIQNRVAYCKRLFPVWVNWDYIKELFLMPGGCNEKGLKPAAKLYYSNLNNCPYQVYINWRWDGSEPGNILYNDAKFLTLLYQSIMTALPIWVRLPTPGSRRKGTSTSSLKPEIGSSSWLIARTPSRTSCVPC